MLATSFGLPPAEELVILEATPKRNVKGLFLSTQKLLKHIS
jgi:hypothetical protein